MNRLQNGRRKMNQTQTNRIEVVDALRGLALCAIVIVHCFEHYNLYYIPENAPQWLTNYILQSIVGVSLFYGFGLGLYRYTGATICLLIALGIFTLQFLFSRWWLGRHRQGPLEWVWKKLTWVGVRRE